MNQQKIYEALVDFFCCVLFVYHSSLSFIYNRVTMTRFFFIVFTIASLQANSQMPHPYKIFKTYPVAGTGWWDYLTLYSGKLYVSHGTQVNILDENSGASLGIIANTPGVHGIAFDEATSKGFTSNGRSDNVTVFDAKTSKTLGLVATGGGPDAILYEPFSKTIITCNGRGKSLSIIDPVRQQIKATVLLNAKPEEAASDGAGHLYVNLEDKNELAVVNTRTWVVEARWSLAPGKGPTGIAIDIKTKRLFAGCDNNLLIVLDALTGKIVSKIKIGAGCDGVVFDKRRQLIFTSNGEGTLSVIKEKSANEFITEGNYRTERGARTIAIDEPNGWLFLPAANFERGNGSGKQKMMPAILHVLVVK